MKKCKFKTSIQKITPSRKCKPPSLTINQGVRTSIRFNLVDCLLFSLQPIKCIFLVISGSLYSLAYIVTNIVDNRVMLVSIKVAIMGWVLGGDTMMRRTNETRDLNIR